MFRVVLCVGGCDFVYLCKESKIKIFEAGNLFYHDLHITGFDTPDRGSVLAHLGSHCFRAFLELMEQS